METETLTLSLDNSAIMEFLGSAQKLLQTATMKQKEAFAADVDVVISCDLLTEIEPGGGGGMLKVVPTAAAIECLRKHGAY